MNLLTDSSASPQTGTGIGGYLLIDDFEVPDDECIKRIQLKVFDQVTSTDLELKTLIWALNELDKSCGSLSVYTDSQNIIQLLTRRKRLEDNNFTSGSGKQLKHMEVYKTFYELHDRIHFEVIKVRGHSQSDQKNEFEKKFTLLDRQTRKELRKRLKK